MHPLSNMQFYTCFRHIVWLLFSDIVIRGGNGFVCHKFCKIARATISLHDSLPLTLSQVEQWRWQRNPARYLVAGLRSWFPGGLLALDCSLIVPRRVQDIDLQNKRMFQYDWMSSNIEISTHTKIWKAQRTCTRQRQKLLILDLSQINYSAAGHTLSYRECKKELMRMITASVQIFLWHLSTLSGQVTRSSKPLRLIVSAGSCTQTLSWWAAPQTITWVTGSPERGNDDGNTANTTKHIFPGNATKVASQSPMLLVGLTRNLCLWVCRTATRPPRIGLATQPYCPVTLNGGVLP